MKPCLYIILVQAFLFFSCSQNPEQLLTETKRNLLNKKRIKYDQLAFYQNPMGTFDEFKAKVSFHKNKKSVIGYDFLIKDESFDYVNINGELKSINHSDKTVDLYSQLSNDQLRLIVNSITPIKFSPFTFLQDNDWQYVGDTLIEKTLVKSFYRVENDTIIDGNEVYTEQKIFINPEAKLITQWVRQNFYKGEPSQTIIYKFNDYEFSFQDKSLAYSYPENYLSIPYGSSTNNLQALKKGEKAPEFIAKDLENNPIKLEDYRGKKILLNFSIIRCGNCALALDRMKEPDFKLPDNMVAFYINPHDKEAEVIKYAEVKEIPISVIPNAQEIGEKYGVAAYPRFFIIDEQGIIEEVGIGYDKQFIDRLKG